MLRFSKLARPFSTANAQLSLTPKFFLMTYNLSQMAPEKGNFYPV